MHAIMNLFNTTEVYAHSGHYELTLFNPHRLSSPLSQHPVNQTSHQHPIQTAFVKVP